MALRVRVISQHPPGGRCSLYAGYAEVLAAQLEARTEVVVGIKRGAHGAGFPSMLVNGVAVQPADGVILMPADVCAALVAAGQPPAVVAGLVDVLEASMERVLGAA